MNNENQPLQLYHQHELDAWISAYSAALASESPRAPSHAADDAVRALRERTLEYRRQLAVEAREKARAYSGGLRPL